ncbi:zf-HC2 domain-containing protein [bacterium]|nr:zf-HC2 domain-containing protein [bacterium]RQV94409.1 MAG: hypothetical protein EH221_08145 [bacterium]
MNPCQRFKESIFDLVDNELDIPRRKELESHLKTCTACTRFLAQIRNLRSQCSQLSRVKVSEEFHILLRERIRREMAGKRAVFSPSISFSGRLIPAFGIMVVVICLGFWMLDQKTSFFEPSSNKMTVSQMPLIEQEDFEGEIQYVIDDYRSPVSISRSSEEGETFIAETDSVLRGLEQDYIQNRLTPVSF